MSLRVTRDCRMQAKVAVRAEDALMRVKGDEESDRERVSMAPKAERCEAGDVDAGDVGYSRERSRG